VQFLICFTHIKRFGVEPATNLHQVFTMAGLLGVSQNFEEILVVR
jgi:hypothetical protein